MDVSMKPVEGHSGSQPAGGLEAHSQSRKEPQAVEGQRLLKAFVQTRDGRDVEAPPILTQLAQGHPARHTSGVRRPAAAA
jgi:hypothetical protein